MNNLADFVAIEIGKYFENCYDGIRSVRYKASFNEKLLSIECLFKWGEFSAMHMLSIADMMDDFLRYKAIEQMMRKVSHGFVEMAVRKQNEAAIMQSDK